MRMKRQLLLLSAAGCFLLVCRWFWMGFSLKSYTYSSGNGDGGHRPYNNGRNHNYKNMTTFMAPTTTTNGEGLLSLHNHNYNIGQKQGVQILRINKKKKHVGKDKIVVDQQHPLLVLSLPGHGDATVARYFQCAYPSSSSSSLLVFDQKSSPPLFGRQFTTLAQNPKQKRPSIGQCMLSNLINNKTASVLQGCGDYSIWQDLSHVDYRRQSTCFDPVLYPGSLTALAESFPEGGTIWNGIQDPKKWYHQSLSYDQHRIWSQICNNRHHGQAFPTDPTEEAYVQFYQTYKQILRQFVQDHSHWTLLEVDITPKSALTVAAQLKTIFDIPASCWLDSIQGTVPRLVKQPSEGKHDDDTPTTKTVTTITHDLFRPNDITFPIFVASLPKSGTTTVHAYLTCNLGSGVSSHQWLNPFPNSNTNTNNNNTKRRDRRYSAAECMRQNIRDHRPLFENCGSTSMFRAFADTAILWNSRYVPAKKRFCYLPQIHGGIEAFAQSYPYGTLVLGVRHTRDWAQSARRWKVQGQSLLDLWATSSLCQSAGGIPPAHSKDTIWEQWYDNVTDHVRQVARDHPTLKYIEIPLTDQAGPLLDNIFGFLPGCWGHANANAHH